MKISVLTDDLPAPPFLAEHGLSFFIETQNRRILFDMGKSDVFLKNAALMGIDLAAADLAVISHGHYDHGGGLSLFLKENTRAAVYLCPGAFEPHYSKRDAAAPSYIGLDQSLERQDRLVFVPEEYRPDDSLLLFSGVSGGRLISRSNGVLLKKDSDGYRRDDFLHEQNLLIREDGKNVLVCGCSHRGIVNILEKAMELAKGPMDLVIGGFHLSNPRTGSCEPRETIAAIADYLVSYPTVYYTCHCTGTIAYEALKETMGDRLRYAGAGAVIEI